MPARDAKLLGAYILPGSAMDPLAGLQQTAEAERLGLGEVWLSELQGPFKDAGAVLGYLGHATSQVGLGTSVTHFVTRHPMILASWGATMQVLTGGRFRLGFGRSLSFFMRNLGLSMPNIGSMEDYAGILRRLWTDEKVSS